MDDTINDNLSGDIIPESTTGASSFGSDDIIGEVTSYQLPVTSNVVWTGNGQQETGNWITISWTSNGPILSLRIKNCVSPWWKFVPKNSYVIAYEARSSAECKREKRYCNNGSLDGSFQYDTCFYASAISKQKENADLTLDEFKQVQFDFGLFALEPTPSTTSVSKTIEDMSTPIGQDVGPGVVISSKTTDTQNTVSPNGSVSGWSGDQLNTKSQIIFSATNDPNKHYIRPRNREIKILPNGQTELNNNVLKSISLQKQLIGIKGTTYKTDIATLGAKSSYIRKVCTTPEWTLISNGQFITAFKSISAENGVCEAETRFCLDGKLQGSYNQSFCNGQYPSIIANSKGLDLINDALHVGYTETRNVLKNDLVRLDPMPIPLTDTTNSNQNDNDNLNSLPDSVYFVGE